MPYVQNEKVPPSYALLDHHAPLILSRHIVDTLYFRDYIMASHRVQTDFAKLTVTGIPPNKDLGSSSCRYVPAATTVCPCCPMASCSLPLRVQPGSQVPIHVTFWDKGIQYTVDLVNVLQLRFKNVPRQSPKDCFMLPRERLDIRDSSHCPP